MDTFKIGETVVVDINVEGVDNAIAGAVIRVDDLGNERLLVDNQSMTDMGNQNYRYLWDTDISISGVSRVSIAGIYKTTITATDTQGAKGIERFNIRITE